MVLTACISNCCLLLVVYNGRTYLPHDLVPCHTTLHYTVISSLVPYLPTWWSGLRNDSGAVYCVLYVLTPFLCSITVTVYVHCACCYSWVFVHRLPPLPLPSCYLHNAYCLTAWYLLYTGTVCNIWSWGVYNACYTILIYAVGRQCMLFFSSWWCAYNTTLPP